MGTEVSLVPCATNTGGSLASTCTTGFTRSHSAASAGNGGAGVARLARRTPTPWPGPSNPIRWDSGDDVASWSIVLPGGVVTSGFIHTMSVGPE